ncbi:MAG: DNA mismatch repair endonuclease MutL, partial [Paracoccaceae bacterium]|nr:DNA mismatch repair endonuclease MutL [Paracoccaceae bacterium]
MNRIAAGEVVERPASAVKELVENAIDAGARQITIEIADGGKRLIRVSDDGCGMSADQLPVALQRHATSKIDGSDLLNIQSFGFRGEALPSLGAVGHLSILSRIDGQAAAQIEVSGGDIAAVRPAALNGGTVVELRDLFYATPARLKFMRTDRTEAQAITDVVKRLAMAEPFTGFTLTDMSGGDSGRVTFRADAEAGDMFDALYGRLARILGSDFAENSLWIDAERQGLHLMGYAALPTYSRGSAVQQYFFVNGRPVRDKLLFGALRGAYADFLSRDRHPAVALFLDCDPHQVDVNVHPSKSEVRFRDGGLVRGLIMSGLRHALAEAGHRASTTVAGATLGAMRPETPRSLIRSDQPASPSDAPVYQMQRLSAKARVASYQAQAPSFAETAPVFARVDVTSDAGSAEFAGAAGQDETGLVPPLAEVFPLGAARGQVHENYIISQTEDGLVIVDQHAAHERLVYEKLKTQLAANGVAAQALLIPEIVDLAKDEAAQLLAVADELRGLGLHLEPFGGGAVAVRETPAILG